MIAPGIDVRIERPDDAAEIESVVCRAFESSPYGHRNESAIVAALRNAGALTLSLVAEAGREIVGHAAVSPVDVLPGASGWYGLGPVAVKPEAQSSGIGAALIQAALDRLQRSGASGCVVVGAPEYYGRFGFKPAGALGCEGIPAAYFLVARFRGTEPNGLVRYHAAFASAG